MALVLQYTVHTYHMDEIDYVQECRTESCRNNTSCSNCIPFHCPNTIIIEHVRKLTKGSLLVLVEGPDAAAIALGTAAAWVAALAAASLNDISGIGLVGVVAVSVAAPDNPGRVGHTTKP